MASPHTAAFSIFVVEDEVIVADDLSCQIRDLGYQLVGRATSGEEALEKLRLTRVDVVLMDIALGGKMDGVETATVLKSELGIPCVFITAYSSPSFLARAKVVEPLGYLLKPFTERELQTVLEMATYRAGSEARLRTCHQAFMAVSEGIMIVGRDEQVRSANPAFCAMFGYDASEISALNYRALIGPESAPETVSAIRRALREGEAFSGEVVQYRKDGTTLWNDLSISSTAPHRGPAAYSVCVSRDITERKRFATRSLHAERLQAVGSLASGIAHDLNNILAPIMSMPFLLKPHIKPGEGERYLKMLASSAERGSQTLKQLLVFSRGAEIKRSAIRVAPLCHEIVGLMRETLPRQIQIELTVTPDLPPVVADANQLHLVLLNLCLNARDAMSQGGRLTVGARVETITEESPILPEDYPGGTYVVVAVSDNGTGIAPEIRDRVFTPFFSTKPIGKGTGLGLSTVNGIVRSHFGFIRLESELNVGTTFEVFLPADKASVLQSDDANDEEFPSGNGEKILVVDDEREVAEATRAILDIAGYQVLVSHNGREALALFAAHQSSIQLVITDLMMPVLNGSAVITAIRELSPSVPFLVLSGLNTEDEEVFKRTPHTVRILEKPVLAENLLTAVSDILQARPPSEG